MSAPVVEVGIISVVKQDASRAIFLDVELAHHAHSTGDPVVARCRWCSPYGGQGFGDWWVPQVGMVVLCLLPGIGIDGSSGDIDEAYAFAVVPGGSRPPVDGLQDVLSATRRVSKTRDGESLDEHIRGEYAQTVESDRIAQINGDESRGVAGRFDDLVEGDAVITMRGTEERETVGAFQWLFRVVANFLGNAAIAIISQTTLTLTGTNALALTGSTTTLSAATSATLTSALVRLASAVVELGSGTLRRLVDERFIAAFNAHSHNGNFNPPVTPIVDTDVCTINTKAS